MTTRSGETRHRTAASLRVLLTGGRAPVTLDLARMLHRAGHRVYVAESAARHLTRLSSAVEQCAVVPSPRHDTRAYLAELERLVQDWQIDLLIPMCEEVFYVAQGADRLRAFCRVLVTTLEQLHVLHHKYDFIQLAGSLGLSVPDTHLIHSRQEWMEAQSVLGKVGDWVWKPVYSRFAAKVRMPTLMNDEARAGTDQEGNVSEKKRRHIRNDPPEEGELSSISPWVAQAYIPGQMLCTYSIAHEGKLVAHATYDSRYRTGSVGASVFLNRWNMKVLLRG